MYKTWRAFEQPPLKNGAPDYTQATFLSRMPAFKKLKGQLLSMDTTGWTIEQQADWHLLMAEMNGFDFNFVQIYIKTKPDEYYTLTSKIYGIENIDERLCSSLAILDGIQILE